MPGGGSAPLGSGSTAAWPKHVHHGSVSANLVWSLGMGGDVDHTCGSCRSEEERERGNRGEEERGDGGLASGGGPSSTPPTVCGQENDRNR